MLIKVGTLRSRTICSKTSKIAMVFKFKFYTCTVNLIEISCLEQMKTSVNLIHLEWKPELEQGCIFV